MYANRPFINCLSAEQQRLLILNYWARKWPSSWPESTAAVSQQRSARDKRLVIIIWSWSREENTVRIFLSRRALVTDLSFSNYINLIWHFVFVYTGEISSKFIRKREHIVLLPRPTLHRRLLHIHHFFALWNNAKHCANWSFSPYKLLFV